MMVKTLKKHLQRFVVSPHAVIAWSSVSSHEFNFGLAGKLGQLNDTLEFTQMFMSAPKLGVPKPIGFKLKIKHF